MTAIERNVIVAAQRFPVSLIHEFSIDNLNIQIEEMDMLGMFVRIMSNADTRYARIESFTN